MNVGKKQFGKSDVLMGTWKGSHTTAAQVSLQQSCSIHAEAPLEGKRSNIATAHFEEDEALSAYCQLEPCLYRTFVHRPASNVATLASDNWLL